MTPHHEVLDGADPGGPGRSHQRARMRRIGSALSGVLVFGALAVLAASVVGSAQSRFAATTSNQGSLITTGAIDIVLADGAEGDGLGVDTRPDVVVGQRSIAVFERDDESIGHRVRLLMAILITAEVVVGPERLAGGRARSPRSPSRPSRPTTTVILPR